MSNIKAGLKLFAVTFFTLFVLTNILSYFEGVDVLETMTFALIASASLALLAAIALWIGLAREYLRKHVKL